MKKCFNNVKSALKVVAGVGGTGVVTIGALVAMAAHIKGNEVGCLIKLLV